MSVMLANFVYPCITSEVPRTPKVSLCAVNLSLLGLLWISQIHIPRASDELQSWFQRKPVAAPYYLRNFYIKISTKITNSWHIQELYCTQNQQNSGQKLREYTSEKLMALIQCCNLGMELHSFVWEKTLWRFPPRVFYVMYCQAILEASFSTQTFESFSKR